MVNYAWGEQSQGKLWRRLATKFRCNISVRYALSESRSWGVERKGLHLNASKLDSALVKQSV